MFRPCRDRCDGGQTGHQRRRRAVGNGAVAELAGAIQPPGPDRAVNGECHAVRLVAIDGAHIDQTRHLEWGGAVRRRSIAELAEEIPSPTPGAARYWRGSDRGL